MAEFHAESAYHNIAMRPDERFLFGMRWRNTFFVDLAIPFGLRSAAFIFNSIAEMVEWILKSNYLIKYLLHYLDDFLSLASAGSSKCADNGVIALSVFFSLGAAPSFFKVQRSDHSPNLPGSRAQFHHSNSSVTTRKAGGHIAASPRVGGQEMV